MITKKDFVVAILILFCGFASIASAMSPATDAEIAQVKGMCCCVYNVGAMCTYSVTINECDFKWWDPRICDDPGADCKSKTDGPSKHDTTATGEPGQTCTIDPLGWCVKYIDGECEQKWLLGDPWYCPCEGTQKTSGTRDTADGADC